MFLFLLFVYILLYHFEKVLVILKCLYKASVHDSELCISNGGEVTRDRFFMRIWSWTTHCNMPRIYWYKTLSQWLLLRVGMISYVWVGLASQSGDTFTSLNQNIITGVEDENNASSLYYHIAELGLARITAKDNWRILSLNISRSDGTVFFFL